MAGAENVKTKRFTNEKKNEIKNVNNKIHTFSDLEGEAGEELYG